MYVHMYICMSRVDVSPSVCGNFHCLSQARTSQHVSNSLVLKVSFSVCTYPPPKTIDNLLPIVDLWRSRKETARQGNLIENFSNSLSRTHTHIHTQTTWRMRNICNGHWRRFVYYFVYTSFLFCFVSVSVGVCEAQLATWTIDSRYPW